MGFADPVSLHGRHVSLVQLSHSHHDNLVDAVKDGELWTLWYTKIPPPEGMRAEIDRRLELQKQGSMIAFAVIDAATREAVGMTPHAYQTQVRVRRAKSLLQAGLPITLAAAEAGFYDQAHLNRHFKRIVGLTPGRYVKDNAT